MMFRDLWKVEKKPTKEELALAAKKAAEKAAAEAARTEEERARQVHRRKISIHKCILAFLIVVVAVLGYRASAVFDDQSGKIEHQRARAYVMPRVQPHVSVPASLPLAISIPLENTGMTPAYGVSARLWMKVAKYPLPKSVDLEEGEEYHHPSHPAVIKPGDEGDNIADVTITAADPIAEDFSQLKGEKRLALYIVGTVTYHDEYNANHDSKFCLGYRANGENTLESFTCRLHNDAD